MPSRRSWFDDGDRERRVRGLAALVRRVWRELSRTFSSSVLGPAGTTVPNASTVSVGWLEALDGPVLAYVGDVYVDAAARVAGAVDAPGDLLIGEDLVRLHLRRARNRLRGVGDDVWEILREQLVLGAAEGDSTAQLAARVRSVIDVPEGRALTIARTEVHAAAEAGAYDQALLVDPDATKVWLATSDSRTRETHRLADGQRVKIGEPFSVGGSALRYPGDPLGAADQTVNCRCSVAYDFDIVTSVNSDPVEESLVAAAAKKWNPSSHPRGKDGKFIKKGAVQHLLSTKKPLISDVTHAVYELDEASWGKLTDAQQQYVVDSVAKLPAGSSAAKVAGIKISDLSQQSVSAPGPGAKSTPDAVDTVLGENVDSVTQGHEKATVEGTLFTIAAHKGAAPGSPTKVTTTLIWGKYEPGTVILDTPGGTEFIRWDGKKYLHVVDGQQVAAWTKKDAYAQLKGGTHWVVPGSPTSSSTPSSVDTAPASTKLDEWLASFHEGFPNFDVSKQLADQITQDEWDGLTTQQKKDLFNAVLDKPSLAKKIEDLNAGQVPLVKPTKVVTNWDLDLPKPEVTTEKFVSTAGISVKDGKKYLIDTSHPAGTVVGVSASGKQRLVATGAPLGEYPYALQELEPSTNTWVTTSDTVGGLTAIQVLRGSPVSASSEKQWTAPQSLLNAPATNFDQAAHDLLLSYVETNVAISAQEAAKLVGNMTQDEWDDLTSSQKTKLALGVDTALDNSVPGANQAFDKLTQLENAEPKSSVSAPTSTSSSEGTLGSAAIFNVGLKSGVNGDVLAHGKTSPDATNTYRLRVLQTPTGKVIVLEAESDEAGKWTQLGSFNSHAEFQVEWADVIKWDPPPSPVSTSDDGDDDGVDVSGTEIESEDQWVELLDKHVNVATSTTVATTANGKFKMVAHPGSEYSIEELSADGKWVDIDPFTFDSLDEEEKLIGEVAASYGVTWVTNVDTSSSSSVSTSPTTSPSVPVTPPAAAAVSVGVADVPAYVKADFKSMFKADNVGYWSKPEKIWDTIKKIQEKYPDPSAPDKPGYSALTILQTMDAKHKGKDPSPYETKMVKWVASAKGQAYAGSATPLATSESLGTSTTSPDTTSLSDVIWSGIQSKHATYVVGTGTASTGLKMQLVVTKSGTESHAKVMAQQLNGDWFDVVVLTNSEILQQFLNSPSGQTFTFNPEITATVGSSSSPVTTSVGASTVIGGGDISNISDAKQQALYAQFKKQPSTYLNSEPIDIYAALKTIADDEGISLLQMLRVVDAVGAKKVKKPDEHLFEKKMVAWFKTPQGAAAVSGVELPLPPSPAFAKGVAGDQLKSFAATSHHSYDTISTTKASSLWKQFVGASSAGDWTTSQRASLRSYTGGIYYSINAYYYGKLTTISPMHEKAAKNAQAGMRLSTVPMMLHRGVGYDGIGNAKNHADLVKLVGEDWQSGGFFSTSVGGDAAFSHKPVLVEVEAPPGTPMAYLKSISQYSTENEMLLAAGLNYRIISVKKDGVRSVVRVRVVPPLPGQEASK